MALAILILWRVGHYDIKGAAIESVWHVATGQRTKDDLTAIEEMAQRIGYAPTHSGAERRTVFTLIGHFIAQALSIAALFILAAGAILLVVG